MGHKPYHWIKLYIDRMTCTKFRLIFLVTIAFLLTVSDSFAEQTIGNDKPIEIQDLEINCKAEKSKNMTILQDTKKVNVTFVDGCCGIEGENEAGSLKERLKEALKNLFADGPKVSYRGFLEQIYSSGCSKEDVIEDGLPVSEGDSQDYSYVCYTEDQLKAYYVKLVEFYEKLEGSGN